MADKNKLTEYYTRPTKLGKWEGFKQFLWNGETSECLGRTGGSWAKILLFYIIFYAALAGFFAAMLAVFYQTLDPSKPKWMLDNGLIGSNPGLGFRPMPEESNVESTLVWFEAANEDNTKHWISALDEFLAPYAKPDKHKREKCTPESGTKEGKVCEVDVSAESFQQCTSDKQYGYSSASPCVFLKLNKIYDWEPVFYNTSNDLPENMPEDLRDHIAKFDGKDKRGNMIWISCEGENPADIENLGHINYIPDRGFPGYYYPFTNQKGYQAPVLAINFERPKTGVLINIECKAWARNIYHDRAERRGSVHFELMVD